MPSFYSILTFFLVFVTFSFASTPAQAVRVKNLDDTAHQLAISSTPGDERVIELQPGEIFNTYSPSLTMKLLTGEHPSTQRGRYLDEYIIWPDGRLHIQKRRWPGHTAYGL